MPAKGYRAKVCKRGHDLTAPGARLKLQLGGRGAGGCKTCLIERTRVKRGSTKTGPASRYKGDETARLAALSAGLKRCPNCEKAKALEDFSIDRAASGGRAPYCRACRAQQKREAYKARQSEMRLRSQARRFGISVGQIEAMLVEQDGVCAICRRVCITGRALAVDHDHATGLVRSLLCANCNRAIGLMQDSPDVARSALDYLLRWQREQEGLQSARMP